MKDSIFVTSLSMVYKIQKPFCPVKIKIFKVLPTTKTRKKLGIIC